MPPLEGPEGLLVPRKIAATRLGAVLLPIIGCALAGGFGLLTAFVVSPSAAQTVSATASFAPTDDTYASANRPDTVHASLSYLRVDSEPTRVGYVKFSVSGLSGTVRKATLRLSTTTASAEGFDVHAVADTSWSESTLTYSNAPALSPTVVASSGPFSAGVWVSLDVTSLISGDGTYSFALTTSSSKSLKVASKEAGASVAPQLVVETATDDATTSTSDATTTTSTSDATTTTSDATTTTSDATTTTSTTSTTTSTTSTTVTSLALPARAAFYYPWFPETWTVNGAHVFYNPTLGDYDSSTSSVVDAHIRALDYAKVKVGIASWWGVGTHSESVRIPLLLDRAAALGSPLKWTLYYEKEGSANPTVTEIQSDLNYLKTNYASNPSYAYVNGKPVIFVYNADDTTCEVVDRWRQAVGTQWYLVLKVFSGYRNCLNQPDSWHQYAPAVAEDSQSGYSFAISPGFWRADETIPRLARDLPRWNQNIRNMLASNAPWQLVTTFNEWGEGSSVESAVEWSSPSGYGDYIEALHNDGQPSAESDTDPPAAPTGLAVTSQTQSSVSFSWSASTDNVGVTGYNIYVNGTGVGNTTTTSATVSGLSCGTTYTLGVSAYDAAGNVSPISTISASTSACSAASDPVIAAAGDICGSSTNCAPTANLLDGLAPNRVLTLGDNAYPDGTLSQFQAFYDPNWGRFKAKTSPAPGNHDYHTSGASGYFTYFGAQAPAAYYSFNLGAWHLISLNSEISMSAGSAQETWLKNDLAANPNTCVLAYWHRPRFSSGSVHGSSTTPAVVWNVLYNAGVDVVLNGHEHNYERFALQNPSRQPDPKGIREFVVGTGGISHYSFGTPLSTSEVRNGDTYGVLKLTLHATGYDWKFLPEAGKSFTDSGSTNCHS